MAPIEQKVTVELEADRVDGSPVIWQVVFFNEGIDGWTCNAFSSPEAAQACFDDLLERFPECGASLEEARLELGDWVSVST